MIVEKYTLLMWIAVLVLVTIANYAEAGIIEIYDNFNDKSFLLNNLVPPDVSYILTKDTHYSIRLFDTKQG